MNGNNGFKIGDRVRCINPGYPSNGLELNEEYTISAVDGIMVAIDGGRCAEVYAHRFEPVTFYVVKGAPLGPYLASDGLRSLEEAMQRISEGTEGQHQIVKVVKTYNLAIDVVRTLKEI
jgi:hypothetical protein